MAEPKVDVITPETAVTLDGLLRERVKRSPDAIAYREFNSEHANWRDYTWAQIAHQVARWQAALAREDLQPGDRVALMLRNGIHWIIFDQAALGLGLVDVPLYTVDRPDNAAYVMRDAGVKLLLVETAEQWQAFKPLRDQLTALIRVVCLAAIADDDARVVTAAAWLPDEAGESRHLNRDPHRLASVIYTSGTTGRPKGVMLSHANMLSNAHACAQRTLINENDVFLSFLPLSHTFERTATYLIMMVGATTAFARSIPLLSEDFQVIRPTRLIAVPRIFERVCAAIDEKLALDSPLRRKLFDLTVAVGYARFEHAQGRAKWRASQLGWPLLDRLVARKIRERFGGRLRGTMCGGAALTPATSRTLIGLGIPLVQGYGLTETSPVVCANSPSDNVPASIGKPISGVEVKIGEQDALLVKGPNVMLGYWNNRAATDAVLSADGWLNTGDTARIDGDGHVFITGRLKDIIVMSNGEKVPPADMETAILRDPVFEQVMLIGEARSYLSALVVPNRDRWSAIADREQTPGGKNDLALARIAQQLEQFPGYAQVRRVAVIDEPWTVENGALTPTLKLKRAKVLERHWVEVERMYHGH